MILRIASLLLLCCASLPLMAEEGRSAPDGSGCPGATSANERDETARAAPSASGAETESVSRDKSPSGQRGGNAENSVRAPRTHSLLPGMFR